VAILPYIEQDALYRAYQFNEPWDSSANRRVLEQMPALFRSPSADPRSTSSSYFVLTGPETIFSGKEGAKFQQITDGTSNTLLIVEARRDIPWTKPEDIPYESGQPLPKLGGYTQGGFNAAFADGSVRFLHEAIDEKMLRALITKAGGELINAVDGPPPARR
jgi:prepilin-type processing-associated H-X9-DG protein